MLEVRVVLWSLVYGRAMGMREWSEREKMRNLTAKRLRLERI